jgi:hypothetical protein
MAWRSATKNQILHDIRVMINEHRSAAGTAIREMPILQRTPPAAGTVTGRAVAKVDSQVAVATAANRFIVIEAGALGRDVQIGETLSLLFSQGRPSIDNDRGRER